MGSRLSAKKKDAFLEAYAKTGKFSEAGRIAGCDPTCHNQWLIHDPEYPERFKRAEAQSVQILLDEVHRRGVNGVDEPVGWYQGVAGGTVRRYSDNLLMFMTKAKDPRYRDSASVELSSPKGRPLEVRSVAEDAIVKAALAVLVEAGVISATHGNGVNGSAKSNE